LTPTPGILAILPLAHSFGGEVTDALTIAVSSQAWPWAEVLDGAAITTFPMEEIE
jgi:hypothetical protein